MTIARKPKGNAQASEAQIAALIDKGGSAADQTVAAPNNLAVALRIPEPLAERLTQALKDDMTRIPRHTWILQAIVEKLDRETRTLD